MTTTALQRARRAAALTAVLLVAAAGCSGQPDQAGTGGNGAIPLAGEGENAQPGEPQHASLGGTTTDGKPLLTTEVGLREVKAKVELLGVTRTDGGLITARVRLTSIGGAASDVYQTYDWAADWTKEDSIDTAYLVDPVGKKKYLAVKDTKGTCLCSRRTPIHGGGEVTELYATFPPVPGNPTSLTIVFPDLPPFEHVTPGS